MMDNRLIEARESASIGRLTPPLEQWAGARTDYPREESIAALFEHASAKFPNRVALSFRGANVSYSELNRRANLLAHRLLRMGVGTESLVGLCVERSPEMIVAMLAILKAGAAYVPFDATYPAERIEFMIADTKPPVMLTQRSFASSIGGTRNVPTIFVDEASPDSPAGDEQNPRSPATASSLAYVMYTSGSTGRPKGVMVEHRSIVRLVFNTNYCQFGPDEVFLQLAPISFDASTFEIWGALLHGATLVIMPPQPPSLQEIGDHIREHQVTTMWLAAGLFHLFVDQRLEALRPLRQLLAGGDSLSSTHVRKVLEDLPHLTLINGYGPTENTTFTCCHTMRHGDTIPNSVSIGRPISNTFVYLLNDALQPVPFGEVGELCAGGDGVARGYLNSPELTAEKFADDPFSSDLGARLYRTGDLARWQPDGTFEFLGRSDTQVKILGHRIELAEIETVLSQHPAVHQACVHAQTDALGNKRLVAYCVSDPQRTTSAEQLKTFLSAKLPAYMLPASFVFMNALPLTPNGKVDRGALPAPTEAKESPSQHGKGTDLEEKLAGLWKEVLGTQHIGLDENFFDLGGDSLLLVAVHSQLQKILQREIQITDLFEYVTVRSLARHLGESAPKMQTFTAAQEQAKKQREALSKKRLVKEMTP
jgi:amino acid adenylation domain-containing protein